MSNAFSDRFETRYTYVVYVGAFGTYVIALPFLYVLPSRPGSPVLIASRRDADTMAQLKEMARLVRPSA